MAEAHAETARGTGSRAKTTAGERKREQILDASVRVFGTGGAAAGPVRRSRPSGGPQHHPPSLLRVYARCRYIRRTPAELTPVPPRALPDHHERHPDRPDSQRRGARRDSGRDRDVVADRVPLRTAPCGHHPELPGPGPLLERETHVLHR